MTALQKVWEKDTRFGGFILTATTSAKTFGVGISLSFYGGFCLSLEWMWLHFTLEWYKG